MAGIQLPIGIETVNPVDADYKRGPWASIAAGLAGINIAVRYNNLSFYVIGDPNEYYWLDTDLSDAGLLTRSTGGSPAIVSITRAALQALISSNSVVVNTTYSITNAQDALGGQVTVKGVAVNRIDGNGQWSFIGKLPAQGYFRLATGNSGSVNQITVTMPLTGVTNLMTSSISYTSSRNNTANLVVANINANSLVSGCRAFVITSTTFGGNFDTPIIGIEAIETTTSFVHTMSINVNTLTVDTILNPEQGFNPNNLILSSFYDITTDRILQAFDVANNTAIAVTNSRITGLTYNPVTTFRWRDPRFLSINLTNTGMRNIIFTGSTVRSRLTATESSMSNFIISTFRDVNLFANSTLSNILSTGFSFSNYNSSITVSSVQVNSLFQISNNSQTTYSVTNSTFANVLNLIFNTGLISITTVNATGTFTLTNNFITPSISSPATLVFSASTFPGVVTFNKNEIYESTSLDSLNCSSIVVVENEMHGIFKISGTATSLNIRRSVFNPCSLTLTFGAFVISGTLPAINILDSEVSMDMGSSTITPTSFDIHTSKIDTAVSWARILAGPINIQRSEIGIGSVIGTAGGSVSSITILYSTISYSDLTGSSTISLTESNLKNCVLSGSLVQMNKSSLERFIYTSNLDINNTYITNNNVIIKYYHDFLITQLSPGTPITITNGIFGFLKRSISVLAWTTITHTGSPSFLDIGINGSNVYFSHSTASLSSVHEDNTVNNLPITNTTDNITIATTGSTINGGTLSLTISGVLLSQN